MAGFKNGYSALILSQPVPAEEVSVRLHAPGVAEGC
jgi:hypothetical protein